MKKIILSLLFSCSGFCQEGLFIKGGLSINDNELGSKQVYSPSGRASYFVGASYIFKPKPLGYELELQFTNAGSKGSIDGTESQINLNTINAIFTADYFTNENLVIKVGPYAGYVVKPEFKYGSTSEKMKDLKDFDFGLAIGAYYFFSNKFFVEGKVLIGMLDLNDNEDFDTSEYKIKNRLFQFGIGYNIF